MIFIDFSACFGRFWPLLEDLELFLRPDLGGKLGVCCQLQAYINQRFLAALERFRRGEMLNLRLRKMCRLLAVVEGFVQNYPSSRSFVVRGIPRATI
jgi:hypothetical protein